MEQNLSSSLSNFCDFYTSFPYFPLPVFNYLGATKSFEIPTGCSVCGRPGRWFRVAVARASLDQVTHPIPWGT